MGDIASFFADSGLSINVSDPPWWDSRTYYEDYAPRITGYTHEIDALGGFTKAQFALPTDSIDLWEWFERGLGRHVVVHDSGLNVVWEGFVNEVTVRSGPFAVTIGPLLGVGNYLDMVYSIIDPDSEPPAVGTRERYSDAVAIVQDADSIAKYGEIEKVLSTGGLTDHTAAARILNVYLADNKGPQTAQAFSTGSENASSITIVCAGYVEWLKAYIYNDLTGGETDLMTKMQNVLAADPNNIFSTDYDKIESNTVQVSQWEDEDNTAWDVIKSLCAHGDVNYNRATFGIYENRQAVYEIRTREIAYHQALAEPLTVKTPAGQRVEPWQVRPARWLFYEDFLTGRSAAAPTRRRGDPRYEFIEHVQYIAPRSLAHSGSKQRTLKQMLARYGLMGVGA